MRKISHVVVLVALAVPGAADAADIIEHEKAIRDSYVVVFKPGTTAFQPGLPAPNGGLRGMQTLAPPVREVGLSVANAYGATLRKVYDEILGGIGLRMSPTQARALARDFRVAYIEQDAILHGAALVHQLAPWHLDRIDERSRPRNNHYSYNRAGKGVNLYVIDSGINRISAKFGSRVVNAYTTVGNQFGDSLGHGTAVADFAGGAVNGVAKKVRLHAVRVGTGGCPPPGGGMGDDPVAYQNGCFALFDVLDGINWVVGHRVKPAVANMSLGTSGDVPSLNTAVRQMVDKRVTTTVAAGNKNTNACNGSPSKLSEVITVAATDVNDRRASFSNRGSCVDLFAPGAGLPGGLDGTSFAAPQVAGVAAQYLQHRSNAHPSSVKGFILANASTGKVTNRGSGSPNRLLYQPYPGGSETDLKPVADYTYSCSGRRCTFTSTATDDFEIVSCRWKWGDGKADSFGCGPLNHRFPANSTYGVRLIVTDDAGQTGRKTKQIAL